MWKASPSTKDGGYVADNLHIDDVPNEVAWSFWDLAEQEMLDQKEDMEKWLEDGWE